MAVVRIDLLKAMLLGARQVQRVAGSEEDRARNVEDGVAGLFQQFRSDSEPLTRKLRRVRNMTFPFWGLMFLTERPKLSRLWLKRVTQFVDARLWRARL